MSTERELAVALAAAGFGADIIESRALDGGCIHDVRHLALADGTTVVAKIGRAEQYGLFEEEAASLRALAATGTVLVPKVRSVVREGPVAVLFLTALEPCPAGPDLWRRFGEELAQLHAADAACAYGFESGNHLGTTPQPNPWCDDWVAFNAEHRLGHQLALATGRDLLTADDARCIQRVIDRLASLIPQRPRPALLHGDLWSGNTLATEDEHGNARIAVLDPACSYGDGWADIAMMKLFGGFPQSCFDAYADSMPAPPQLHTRLAVYQLYHVLNHINLFGQTYVPQAINLARPLA